MFLSTDEIHSISLGTSATSWFWNTAEFPNILIPCLQVQVHVSCLMHMSPCFQASISMFPEFSQRKMATSVCLWQTETENGILFSLGRQKISCNRRLLCQQMCPFMSIFSFVYHIPVVLACNVPKTLL